jgi:hypothetical protein
VTVKRALIAVAAAVTAALPATGAAGAVTAIEQPPVGAVALAPGIAHQELQRAGTTVHLVRVRPGPRRTLSPLLVAGRPSARAPLTAALRARAGLGAVAGINGDFFNFETSHPSGLLLLDGVLVSEPEPTRSALLLPPGGGLLAERLSLEATWLADGQAASHGIDGINRPPARGRETLVYTPIFGAATPVGASRFEVRIALDSGGALSANAAPSGTVLARASGGGMPLRPGEIVLTSVGADGPEAAAELPTGARVTITPTVVGLPEDVLQGIGGGPLLVREGRAVENAGEGFSFAQLTTRTARSAVGQHRNGTLLLAMAEGPATGARGITVAEQARLMEDLGAFTAVAMDAGGSAALALGDRLAAPTASERSITNALEVAYSGVHFPPLPTSRMTPNRDGVNDRVRASVRVPRRGALTVALARRNGRAITLTRRMTGPTARRIVLDARRLRLGDGIYTLRARLEPEDGGAPTSHARRLIVDRTLAGLSTRAYARRAGRSLRPRLDIRFRLFRSARATVTIRDADGRRLRTLMSGRRLPAGSRRVTWDRTIRRAPAEGSFLVDVEVRSALGRSGLRRAIALSDPRTGDPEP